ncbi:hypothetical protein SLA2020_274710 [Shorea laevis]
MSGRPRVKYKIDASKASNRDVYLTTSLPPVGTGRIQAHTSERGTNAFYTCPYNVPLHSLVVQSLPKLPPTAHNLMQVAEALPYHTPPMHFGCIKRHKVGAGVFLILLVFAAVDTEGLLVRESRVLPPRKLMASYSNPSYPSPPTVRRRQ